MTDPIRTLDLGEQQLVVSVNTAGELSVAITPDACKAQAARVLRLVAMRLEAAHGPWSCTKVRADRDRKPVRIDGGHLDGDQWTDGDGATWDLSRPLDGRGGGRWKWTGKLDALGAPMLRSETLDDQWPLDAADAVYGPFESVAGDAS